MARPVGAIHCRRLGRSGIVLLLAVLAVAPPAGAGADADQAVERGLSAYLDGKFDRARRHWRGPAEEGEARAQFGLGVLYATGRGVAANRDTAFQWYRRAAAQGHPTAAFRVAQAYAEGRGVAQDPEAARRWYREAAEAGHGSAFTVLGRRYAAGVPGETAKRKAFYEKGVEAGYADAQYHLASLYLHGQGVAADPGRAAELLRRAAEQGHAPAALKLGGLFEDGNGVKRDPAAAAEWYRVAAKRGNAAGQISLARLYAEGKGVEADPAAAYRWYRLAANSRSAYEHMAGTKAERLAKELSSEARDQAKAWLADWQAQGIWTAQYP